MDAVGASHPRAERREGDCRDLEILEGRLERTPLSADPQTIALTGCALTFDRIRIAVTRKSGRIVGFGFPRFASPSLRFTSPVLRSMPRAS